MSANASAQSTATSLASAVVRVGLKADMARKKHLLRRGELQGARKAAGRCQTLCGGYIEPHDKPLPQLSDYVVVYMPKGAADWVQSEGKGTPRPKQGTTQRVVQIMAPFTVKGGDGTLARRGAWAAMGRLVEHRWLMMVRGKIGKCVVPSNRFRVELESPNTMISSVGDPGWHPPVVTLQKKTVDKPVVRLPPTVDALVPTHHLYLLEVIDALQALLISKGSAVGVRKLRSAAASVPQPDRCAPWRDLLTKYETEILHCLPDLDIHLL